MLYVVRHAKTVAPEATVKGQTEWDISSSGYDNIRELCYKFKNLSFNNPLVLSSDLNRAISTAEAIQNILNECELEKTKKLREMDFGKATGGDLTQFRSKNPEYKSDSDGYYYKSYPNGESPREVYERVMDAVNSARRKHEGNLVVVTHTTPIYSIISTVFGVLQTNVNVSVDNCGGFSITDDFSQIECAYKSEVRKPDNI